MRLGVEFKLIHFILCITELQSDAWWQMFGKYYSPSFFLSNNTILLENQTNMSYLSPLQRPSLGVQVSRLALNFMGAAIRHH